MAPHSYNTRSSIRNSASGSSSKMSGMENNGRKGAQACNKRREGGRNVPVFPQEIIFNILLLLPAKVLAHVMKYVCKEWYSIVTDADFILSHHQSLPKSGIITQHNNTSNQQMAHYLESNAVGVIKQTKLEFPFPAKVLGSCHGLVLLQDTTYQHILHVTNPITKVMVSLPPLKERASSSDARYYTTLSCTSSGHYKVVHLDFDGGENLEEVMAYTLGVDETWRSIDVRGTILGDNVGFVMPPLFAGKVIYKDHPFYCLDSSGYALDVDAETIHEIPSFEPEEKDTSFLYTLIRMERGLGLIRFNWKEMKWVVWELTDKDSDRWTKVVSIDLMSLIRSLSIRFCTLSHYMRPICLKNGQIWVIIYAEKIYLACYNLNQGNGLVYPVDRDDFGSITYGHVNTLISPKRC